MLQRQYSISLTFCSQPPTCQLEYGAPSVIAEIDIKVWRTNFSDYSQSSKLAGSPKSEASEIMLRTSETILALVRSD